MRLAPKVIIYALMQESIRPVCLQCHRRCCRKRPSSHYLLWMRGEGHKWKNGQKKWKKERVGKDVREDRWKSEMKVEAVRVNAKWMSRLLLNSGPTICFYEFATDLLVKLRLCNCPVLLGCALAFWPPSQSSFHGQRSYARPIPPTLLLLSFTSAEVTAGGALGFDS